MGDCRWRDLGLCDTFCANLFHCVRFQTVVCPCLPLDV